MGKVKDYLHEWLEEAGFELGYDIMTSPDINDLEWVAENEIDSWTYWAMKEKVKEKVNDRS